MKYYKDSFHPYAWVSIFFWSLTAVLTRLALQYFSAFSLGFLRYLIASVVLLAVAALYKMKPPRPKDLLWFLASGGTGFFLYMIAYNQGQAVVTAATGSVVIAMAPVLTALLTWLIYREKIRPHQWAAVFIEFAGVAVLTLMNGVFSVNRGLFWLFFAALSLSIYNLLQRKLTKTYDSLQTAAYSIFFGTLLLAVFAPESFQALRHAPAIQWFYLLILGVGASAIAYVSWAKAFSKTKQSSQVSNYMFITPLLTSVLGFLLAGEVPDRGTLIGGGIIMTGVLIFNFGGMLFGPAEWKKT